MKVCAHVTMIVLKMASREKRSPISLCDNDDSKATCQVCNEKISRGGSKRKAYNSTNLRKHLQQHAGKYKELLEVEEREQSRKRSKEEEDKLLQPKINETVSNLISAVFQYIGIHFIIGLYKSVSE